MGQYISCLQTSRTSITREILYIFNECGILTRLVRLNTMFLNVTNSKVHSWKYLSVTFSVQNGLKEGHVLLPLLCNFDFK
jgi:hypothetical protein